MTVNYRTSRLIWITAFLLLATASSGVLRAGDPIKQMQQDAIQEGSASWGHWGTKSSRYTDWKSHSNRLIPVYSFGLSLDRYQGEGAAYRDAKRLAELYGDRGRELVNPEAEYFDQTDIYHLQMDALRAGKKYIFLIVFDGMDWQTTQAAAIYKSGKVAYESGRGSGLSFQDYRGVETDYGFMVTSPHNGGTKVDVDAQAVTNPGGTTPGGYDATLGGATPWSRPGAPEYLIGKNRAKPHAVTDSAASATSMTSGIKTYNDAINVGPRGEKVEPIARLLQREHGFKIGVVSSVPISHATPACAYSNNVSRDDYQDLTRDLLGVPSIANSDPPLPGVDVLLGAGWGVVSERDGGQGRNYVPGNKYVVMDELDELRLARGGNLRVVQRTAGTDGSILLENAADAAAREGNRLFGFYGAAGGHLPFRTADGGYDPVAGVKPVEVYTKADVVENPNLAEMTAAALKVLEGHDRFWLMVEAGDVDWANHDDNLDNSIGAVLSGDEAFSVVTDWVERNDCWDETAVILTADHGHYLVLEQPEVVARAAASSRQPASTSAE